MDRQTLEIAAWFGFLYFIVGVPAIVYLAFKDSNNG